MEDWFVNENGESVTLIFKEGQVVVKKADFNRAAGTMFNSTFEEVAHDYALSFKIYRTVV